MSKKIYFDLDGTVYDLYNVENWLEKLRSETEKVFTEGDFLGNYDNFLSAICQLIGYGYSFGVISSLSSSPYLAIIISFSLLVKILR